MIDSYVEQIGKFLISLAPEVIRQLNQGFVATTQNSEFGREIQDVASEYDHLVGKFIGKHTLAKFPNIRIDSEEEEERIGDGDYVLRIDPIDGSKHFIAGIPLFSSLFSISRNDETLFAMILNPLTNSIYVAFKNGGAFKNGRRIYVNNLGIEDCFVFVEHPAQKVYVDSPEIFQQNVAQIDKLARSCFRLRDVGNFGLAGSLVAQGSIGALVTFNQTTKLYDIEAPILIIKEAGGIVGDTYGNVFDKIEYNKNSSKKAVPINLLSANPRAFDEIAKLLN